MLFKSAKAPLAVLKMPMVLVNSANAPMAVLFSPVVLLKRTDARTMKETFWSKLRELRALRRRCQQIKLQQRKDRLLRSVNFMPERSNFLKNRWPEKARSQVTPTEKSRLANKPLPPNSVTSTVEMQPKTPLRDNSDAHIFCLAPFVIMCLECILDTRFWI